MAIEDFEIVISRLAGDDGGGFLAAVRELPGCMSDGDTQEEALANVKDAIAAWIAEAERLGRTVPTPRRVFA